MALDQYRNMITVGSTDLIDVVEQAIEESPNTCVSYEAQSLSTEQKAQARTNLDALGKDENAVSATKATQDGGGNVIADTYAKKTEIPDTSTLLPKASITYGTNDLTAGSSPLTTGTFYFVYE